MAPMQGARIGRVAQPYRGSVLVSFILSVLLAVVLHQIEQRVAGWWPTNIWVEVALGGLIWIGPLSIETLCHCANNPRALSPYQVLGVVWAAGVATAVPVVAWQLWLRGFGLALVWLVGI